MNSVKERINDIEKYQLKLYKIKQTHTKRQWHGTLPHKLMKMLSKSQ